MNAIISDPCLFSSTIYSLFEKKKSHMKQMALPGFFLLFRLLVDLSCLVFLSFVYTERIKFSNFLKCLYCCCFEKYYNAAGHIQLV